MTVFGIPKWTSINCKPLVNMNIGLFDTFANPQQCHIIRYALYSERRHTPTFLSLLFVRPPVENLTCMECEITPCDIDDDDDSDSSERTCHAEQRHFPLPGDE